MNAMKMPAIVAAFVVTLGAGAASAQSVSTVLYDNLNAAPAGADLYSTDYGLGPLADSFSTGSSATTLGTVSVMLQPLFADPPGDYATISLLSDDNDSPGNVIATLGTVDDSDLTFGPAVYQFDGGQTLAANTRYWIEIAGTDTSIGAWDYASDGSATGTSGEYSANFNGVSSNDATGQSYQMEVTAESSVSAAPEPTTWATLLLGVAGIGLVFRQAKRKHGFKFKTAFLA